VCLIFFIVSDDGHKSLNFHRTMKFHGFSRSIWLIMWRRSFSRWLGFFLLVVTHVHVSSSRRITMVPNNILVSSFDPLPLLHHALAAPFWSYLRCPIVVHHYLWRGASHLISLVTHTSSKSSGVSQNSIITYQLKTELNNTLAKPEWRSSPLSPVLMRSMNPPQHTHTKTKSYYM
jgi:hypothetical protein